MFAALRIQLFALFLLAVALVSATSIPSRQEEIVLNFDLDDGTTTSPNAHRLLSRQTAQTTLCNPYTVYLNQNGVQTATIRQRTCYCNYQGSLTPATDADMNTAFAEGSTAINQTAFTASFNGQTRAQALTSLKTSIRNALNARTTTCVYGTGAVPNSCTDCGFACSTTTTKRCGTNCIANTATCASGLAQRRDLDKKNCPLGWEVCETGTVGFGGKSAGWECVNTKSDLESCGGCQQPLQGRSAGVDCTAIVGMSGVACISGICQINSCLKGYKLENNACVPITRSASVAAASSSAAIAAKRSAANANVKAEAKRTASPPAASIVVEKRFTEETEPTAKGQHKVWHKRTQQPTKNQRRR